MAESREACRNYRGLAVGTSDAAPFMKKRLDGNPMKSAYDTIFENGAAYERFMGRWSRQTGRQFVSWLRVPSRPKWLEVGCGTGAFTEVILSECEPSSVTAFDLSATHVAYARERIRDDRVQIKTRPRRIIQIGWPCCRGNRKRRHRRKFRRFRGLLDIKYQLHVSDEQYVRATCKEPNRSHATCAA